MISRLGNKGAYDVELEDIIFDRMIWFQSLSFYYGVDGPYFIAF